MRAGLLIALILSTWLIAEDDYNDGGSAPTQQQAQPQSQPDNRNVQGQGQPIIINAQPNQNRFVPNRNEVFSADFFSNANKPVDEPKTTKSPKGVIRPLDGVGYFQNEDWKTACAQFKGTDKYRSCYQQEKDKTLKAVDASINGGGGGYGKKLKKSPFEEAAKAAGDFDRD